MTRLTCAGIAIGLATAAVLVHTLEGLLFGVEPLIHSRSLSHQS